MVYRWAAYVCDRQRRPPGEGLTVILNCEADVGEFSEADVGDSSEAKDGKLATPRSETSQFLFPPPALARFRA